MTRYLDINIDYLLISLQAFFLLGPLKFRYLYIFVAWVVSSATLILISARENPGMILAYSSLPIYPP